ncbi:50S ribosomal protein L24 [Candidatus Pacearchaeota archaeon CG10_big_fil_rev_8_21_14_0_10_32_42]|nr:MAG: 50S ribosomal protein L24 [Candidatus Pacearchaeota archaeon CG10_big_fil_rev_8_21_14_0_10_32_42]
MKQKFSKAWKSSKQPRKQRKYSANAPLHIKKKFMSVNLSKELRKKYRKRNLPVRKGDVVKIMRGGFKKKQGKIIEVKLKGTKVFVEGIQRKKKDGSKVNVRMIPSNLQIIELNLEDKKRIPKTNEDLKKSSEKNNSEVKEKKSKINKEKTENAPKETESA